MENTIDIGIDLGTTNSIIAKYTKGEVNIFSNPNSEKCYLPSVVAYNAGDVFVGEEARQLLTVNPKSVVSTFKRKMGTCDEYFVDAIAANKSPLELSAEVIKKLRSFVPDTNLLKSAVITIPSSFDTVQANATKEAGKIAGFDNVILLQEPIAVSLAYANQTKRVFAEQELWLVYDLGGGTFDVALIQISNEEIRMLDHEGDTLLGGSDFDRKVVENIIIPYLIDNYKLTNLAQELKSASSKYNDLWKICMLKAEQAKEALTISENTIIALAYNNGEGIAIDCKIELSRQQFEYCTKGIVEHTIRLSSKILERNALEATDIKFILMSGGATKIPYIASTVQSKLGIRANTELDPLLSVVVGAAFFAGTKSVELGDDELAPKHPGAPDIKIAYEKNTKELFASLSATVLGLGDGFSYEIVREDGGFTTGVNELTPQIIELLPLEKNTYNFFFLKVYDVRGQELDAGIGRLSIAQGRYSIVGQLLPEEICLEIDDPESNNTRLLTLFHKNEVLPIKKSINRLINKNVKKGSDDKFVVNVLEGSALSLPIANYTIGYMVIEGKDLENDLHKGADIELIFEMTESRDLKITANIPMLKQQFSQIFTPENRNLPLDKLKSDFESLLKQLNLEQKKVIGNEDYENAKQFQALIDKVKGYITKVDVLSEDDVTDSRYHLEDRKREIANEIFNITRKDVLNKLIQEFLEEKLNCKKVIEKEGNANERKWYESIVMQESKVRDVNNPIEIQNLLDDLRDLKFSILWRIPDYLINVFEWLKSQKKGFRDKHKGKELISSGYKALETENYTWLKQVNFSLLNLLPRDVKKEMIQTGTGIV